MNDEYMEKAHSEQPTTSSLPPQVPGSGKGDILKTNLIFGSAQVVQMVVTIVRAKLIAVFLSSTGMGLNAMLQSVLLTVNNVSSCGIMQSGVREIARARGQADEALLAGTLGVFRRLLVLAGMAGLLLCGLLAYPLSLFSFGDAAYVGTFVLLGLGVMFYTLMHGEMTVLQGTRSVVPLAKGTIVGATAGLLACIPCYCLLGNAGVVWAIVIGYLLNWVVYRRQVRLRRFPVCRMTIKAALVQGRPILLLGAVLMVGTFLVSFFTYLTNVCLRMLGSLDDVGFYQGAASITTQSILVVTSVLASDFFPRLAALTDRPAEHNGLVNNQLELVVLVVTPIAAVVICFADWVVRLLLTTEFLVISPMLQAMAFALLFRGVWVTMSYVILAHGDRRAYLLFDGLVGNGLNFFLNVLAYWQFGLTGLGVAFVASSVLVSLLLSGVVVRAYGFRVSRGVWAIGGVAVGLLLATYAAQAAGRGWGIVVCALTVGWTLVLLEKRFGLLKFLHIKH